MYTIILRRISKNKGDYWFYYEPALETIKGSIIKRKPPYTP
jgi:hypothetical protein